MRKAWSDRCRKAGQGRDVERDKPFNGLSALLGETAGLSHPGIVYQDANASVVAQTRFKRGKISGLGQVGLQHFNSNTAVFSQASGQDMKACHVSCDQHEVMATAGEAFSVDGAYT
ncbi:hypothetical protein V466_25135 [Pseudomonas mandelii PD30]|uniref:Uncharacterized protein n=1 Tax=Pseudomonas mandelii PD30 TaxID=1419583 RepID=A0A059KW70_9PSED|nr:hypothetical protein V466_25135 [Pseudomonas mandelii PD30]